MRKLFRKYVCIFTGIPNITTVVLQHGRTSE